MTEAGVAQRASSEGIRSPGMLMVKEAVVEAVIAALARGETVLSVASAYELDPKTVRSWRRRGQCRARRPASGRAGGPLAPFVSWLEARAPEVGCHAAVLHRELHEQGFTGSEIVVRRAVRPWRLAATPVATVRFESAPGEQAQVDFGQQRVWIADGLVAAQLFVFTLGYSRRLFALAFPQPAVARMARRPRTRLPVLRRRAGTHMARGGIEPPTRGFSVRNLANEPQTRNLATGYEA